MRRTIAVPTVHVLQHGALRSDYSLLCRARTQTGHRIVVAVATSHMLVAAAAVIAAYATAANASVASAVVAIATAAITAATHVFSPPP